MNLKKKLDNIQTLIGELFYGIDIIEKSEAKMLEEIKSKFENSKEKANLDIQFQMVETKSLEDGSGLKIKGIASTPSVDRYGDIVKQDGITFSKYSGKLPILWMHNMWDVRGGWDLYEVRDGKLYVEGTIRNPITDDEKVLVENLKAGNVSALSIGFFVNEAEMIELEPGNYIRVFKQIEIFEISVVTVPANAEALITQVSKSVNAETKSAESASQPAAQVDEAKPESREEKPAEPEVNPLQATVDAQAAEIESLKNQLKEQSDARLESEAQADQLSDLVDELTKAKAKGIL